MRRISDLEKANAIICSILTQEKKRIFNELRKRSEFQTAKITEHSGRNHHENIYVEQNQSINDYRNYQWIKIHIGNEIFWITLFYNDIDNKSGNIHTQFGRIQFWKGVTKEGKKGRYSPHHKVEYTDPQKTYWRFCGENAKDPQMWIDSPTYSPKRVVDEFVKFSRVKKEGELDDKENKVYIFADVSDIVSGL